MSRLWADIGVAGFFALRTPLLPFGTIGDMGVGLTAAEAASGAQFAAAYSHDLATLHGRLLNLVGRPDVHAAISVAAPEIEAHINAWRSSPTPASVRLEHTLARYVYRMSSRATPFGLFAGCSIGRFEVATDLRLPEPEGYLRHIRLDYDYLARLTEHLAAAPELRERLRYQVTSSLYRVADRWRYVRSRRESGGRRQYELMAIDATESLEAVVALAKTPVSLRELADEIISGYTDGEISNDEVFDYLHELIDAQILMSDLQPLVTGDDALNDLIAQLEALGDSSRAQTLSAVRAAVQAEEGNGVLNTSGLRIAEELAAALGVEIDRTKLFQVELSKPSPMATCATDVAAEMVTAAHTLQRISVRPEDSLKRFREAFKARYEGRAVPLFEALDAESGIGFEGWGDRTSDDLPLLAGVRLRPPVEERTVPWTPREAHILSRLQQLWAAGDTVWSLSEADLDALESPGNADLPDSFAILALLAQTSGDFQVFIRSLVGPSCANLLGRFCSTDRELSALVEAELAKEAARHPEAVFAEVVHLPEGRTGNIVARPLLRTHEIPYLGRSGAPIENQIRVSDLMVSVVGDHVHLYSPKLGRPVVPRLSNAHNFSLGQPVYRFLCALQSQDGIQTPGWQWGPFQTAPFLPRVVHGRTVFARARWTLDAEAAGLIGESPLSCFQALQRWRAARKVPRFVFLIDGDQELLIDLESVLSVASSVPLLVRSSPCTIVEMFPTPDALPAHNSQGRYLAELVVPVRRTGGTAVSPTTTKPVSSRSEAPDAHPPGSEWLYLKLYAGIASIDALLHEQLPHIVDVLQKQGSLRSWFFVRFPDPEWHLRLRVRLTSAAHLPGAVDAVGPLLRDMMAAQRIWKSQIDTYVPEVERYGGRRGIEIAEEMFFYDSQAAVEILRELRQAGATDQRWIACVVGWDRLLADFKFSLEEKLVVLTRLRAAFASEFHSDKLLTRTLGNRFRQERVRLEAVLSHQLDDGDPLASALAVFKQRSRRLAESVDRLYEESRGGRLGLTLEQMIGSHLHMHANRILRSSHRAQEFVMYDFLGRYYESELARKRPRASDR